MTEQEIKEAYESALAFLRIQKRGETGEIPAHELDDHIEKNAATYAFWKGSNGLAGTEDLLTATENEYSSWYAEQILAAKKELKNLLGKSSNISEKDCLGHVLSNTERKVMHKDFQDRIRELKYKKRLFGVIVDAYDKRGFHLMNLANRNTREFHGNDSASVKPIK